MLFSSILLSTLVFSVSVNSAPTPIDKSTINISHTSKSTGKTVVTVVDLSTLSPDLANVLLNSTLNLNLVTDRRKRAPSGLDTRRDAERRAESTIHNSTINLTVVGGNRRRDNSSATETIDAASETTDPVPDTTSITMEPISTTTTSSTSTEAMIMSPNQKSDSIGSHSVLIDASGGEDRGSGGIHNSTININVISSKVRRREVDLSHHSILVAPSSSTGEAAIESTTLNINILPRTVVGDHSVIVGEAINASHHSVVVAPTSDSAAIKDSTVNITVVGGNKDSEEVASSVAVEAGPTPSKRSLDGN